MRHLACIFVLASCGVAEAERGPTPSPVTVALRADGRYATLVAALGSTGVDAEIAVHDPFTVLAATDDAFLKMTHKERERLLGNKERLTKYLCEHILVGSYPPNAIPDRLTVRSLAGIEVELRNDEEGLELAGYTVSKEPITTSNAVIYRIDRL